MLDTIKGVLNKLGWNYTTQEEDTILTVIMVTTPYLDKRNDMMQIYITDIEVNSFKLDDGGFITDEFGLKESLFDQSTTAQILAHEMGVELFQYYGRWTLAIGWSRTLLPNQSQSIERRILEFTQALVTFEALSRIPLHKSDDKIIVR